MTGKHFLIFAVVFDVLGMFSAARGGVAHFAHLGGLATGVLFIKQGWTFRIPEIRLGGRQSRSENRKGESKIINAKFTMVREKPKTDSYDDPNFIAKEVDPILEKISAHGIQSLTDRERQILEKAQKHMSKR